MYMSLWECSVLWAMESVEIELQDQEVSSQLGMRSTTIAITFTRLFLLPPIGLAAVLTADRLGFIPSTSWQKCSDLCSFCSNPCLRPLLAGTYILPHKVLVGIRVVWLNPEVHCRLPTACFQGNGSRQRINKCCVVIWTYKEYMKLSFLKTANCIFGYLLEPSCLKNLLIFLWNFRIPAIANPTNWFILHYKFHFLAKFCQSEKQLFQLQWAHKHSLPPCPVS